MLTAIWTFLTALNPVAALRLGLVVAALAALLWIVDEIGDRREAKVWAKINSAIAKTNAEIDTAGELDDRVAAIAEAARIKALGEAARVGGTFKLSKDQALSLNRIR